MQPNMKGTIAMNFLEMAKKKEIDKITVKELAETCCISRQCFYYHFKDIYEVLEWTVNETIRVTIDYILASDDRKEAMKILVFMVTDNRDVFRKIMHSRHRTYVENLLIKEVRHFLEGFVQYHNHMAYGSKTKEVIKDTKIEFCTYGICGLLLKNCVEECVDYDKLAEEIIEITHMLFA